MGPLVIHRGAAELGVCPDGRTNVLIHFRRLPHSLPASQLRAGDFRSLKQLNLVSSTTPQAARTCAVTRPHPRKGEGLLPGARRQSEVGVRLNKKERFRHQASIFLWDTQL